MPTQADLKNALPKLSKNADKLLTILAGFNEPQPLSEVRRVAEAVGLRWAKFSNPSQTLLDTKGKAIRTTAGWELTDLGRAHVQSLGVFQETKPAVQAANDLRAELASIKDTDTRAFVEEAIGCLEARLYRSAIVMSWMAAISVLHHHVVSHHLLAFNNEASRVDARWRTARTPDDLGRMTESDFLERLAGISVIGKNVKKELKDCLDRRNGCGHPNSLKLGEKIAAAHVEVLILNVFSKF